MLLSTFPVRYKTYIVRNRNLRLHKARPASIHAIIGRKNRPETVILGSGLHNIQLGSPMTSLKLIRLFSFICKCFAQPYADLKYSEGELSKSFLHDYLLKKEQALHPSLVAISNEKRIGKQDTDKCSSRYVLPDPCTSASMKEKLVHLGSPGVKYGIA